MKNVFLITKLKTTNIGNEALSSEIMSLFSQSSNDIRLNVNGRPFGLDGYYPKRIIHKKNPVAILDAWAKKVADSIGREPDTDFPMLLPKVKLLQVGVGEMKHEKLKARLRPLKRFLVSFLPYSGQYKKRAMLLKKADWLIYSGAGEVGDNIVFLRQLVEIRAAQLMGIKTAAVNQSVVIKTPVFQKLVGHVYGNMEKVVIRGEITKKNLISYGVPEHIIEVAPDSAINAEAHEIIPARERKSNKVAVNFTPRVKITEDEIGKVIKHLQSIGKEVCYVTNEPSEDRGIAKLFIEKFNIRAMGPFSNYADYIRQLSECDFVISARLHTNMLALVSHTPIIPIEGNVFKTTELLNQLQYPIATFDSATSGWTDKLIREIDQVHQQQYNFDAYFNSVFPAFKQSVKKNAAWIGQHS